MSTFLTSILLRGICGSVVFAVFLLVFAIFGKKLSTALRYYLLLIPLSLCVMPPFNLGINIPQPIADITVPPVHITAPEPQTGTEIITNTNLPAQPSEQTTKPVTAMNISLPLLLGIAWSAGILLLITTRTIGFMRFRATLKRISLEPEPEMSEIFTRVNRTRAQLLCFSGSSTPFTAGLFHAVVFMPDSGLDTDEIKLALLHELTHVRRHDLIIKRLTDAVCILHFYNPIVWLLRREIERYCELSCDETAIKELDINERKQYSLMLLRLMKRTNTLSAPSAAYLGTSEKNIKRRLNIIMTIRKSSKLSRLLSATLAVTLFLGSITISGCIFSLTGSAKSQVSEWASPEITAAERAYLIPRTLSDKNLTEPITRGEFCDLAYMLWTYSANIAADDLVSPFNDTYEPSIIALYNAGIVSGISENKFTPERSLTREEAAVIFDRLLGVIGVQPYIAALFHYADFSEVSEWAKNSVVNMRGYRIMNGYDDIYFRPKTELTREQAISAAYRAYLLNHTKPLDENASYYDRTSVYMEHEMRRVFTPYYEILSLDISNYSETPTASGADVTFFYTMKAKNYYKDPDTVEYIAQARENGSPNYEQLRDEYLAPGDWNFELRLVFDGDDITLYTNIDPHGTDWQPCTLDEFVLTYEPTTATDGKIGFSDPSRTVREFYALFAKRDFNAMKAYCTDSFIASSFQTFGDDSTFDSINLVSRASLLDLKIPFTEYAKSSNAINATAVADIEVSPLSSFYGTRAEYELELYRQDSGAYLINKMRMGFDLTDR